jgi:hypothetical protein
MSILHEINYYEGREEGELTPSPSDEDDDVPDLQVSGVLVVYSNHTTIDPPKRRRYRRRRVPAITNEVDSVSQLLEKSRRESERRLRSLVMNSFRKRQDNKN